MNIRRLYIFVSLLFLCAARAQTPEKSEAVDWNKAKSLYQREQNGQKLSAEEQAYLDHAKQTRRQNQQANQATTQRAALLPPRESTGLVPLNQLKAGESYKGHDGGLYGEGRNDPPEKLLQAALKAASAIGPRDGDGHVSKEGKIVLMSLGMSNTTMEFSRFKQLADRDPMKSEKLVIVDAAQGGQDGKKWDTTSEPSPWTNADGRLKEAGVDPRQVQIIWIKQALAGAGNYGEFPKHSDTLEDHLKSILKLAKTRYPNLQLVYLSSRIYAGYAATPLNPEPFAYEGALTIRSLIDSELKGDLQSPVALWGPYLWADGLKGRSLDKLVWTRADFAADGTHPSDSGRQKVAELLLEFFKTEKTSQTWFLKK